MAMYALVVIFVLGIPFLLYCLWNFAREVKPRRKRALMFSSLPSYAQPASMPRLLTNSSPQKSVSKPRSDRDFTTPVPVS
jgi:hypothetical protein